MTFMRAKMVVESVQKFLSSDKVNFKAVYASNYPDSGLDEDNTYAKFTPNGELSLTVRNPDLIGKFSPGDKFYLDFTRIEP